MAREFQRHDHESCMASGIAALDRYCEMNGIRLTPVRRRVCELLLANHKAVGAYELLDQLRDEGLGSQPPIVYRALEFLTSHGFAHKLEGLNAFIACSQPDAEHDPAFMICRSCNRVAETEATAGSIKTMANEAGFAIEHQVLEVVGLCADCATDTPS